ncbi:uncharacterized protein [Rutidosis leptorrhynchoides]|uniref:uncharacterized protein n=1 Tax=Rutidosis leptorrhynchoides TaxID=125765 RepID=UPI003A9A2D1B
MTTTTEINSNYTNSSNHPLFLHQNDNLGLILISKKLIGSENYSSWKRSMMIALNAKNKLKIVTKEYREPAIGTDLRSLWERNNDMIISWILNTVSEEIGNRLNFINSASSLWDELHEHYAQIDDALEAPYMCSCTCTCENGILNGEREQRKRVIQFLMGLDDSYSNIRGQILLMQPLPSTAKAYGMIKQEEKQREGILPKPITPEECYKNIGYPPGHPLHEKYQPKQFNNRGKTINCIFTDTRANDTHTAAINNQETNSTNDLMAARMDQLQNQLNQVMLMMQKTQSDDAGITPFIASLFLNLENVWVIDSGATDHISISLKQMHNLTHHKNPILVTLPNKFRIKVSVTGSGNNKEIAHGTLCDGLYIIHPEAKPTHSHTFHSMHSSSVSNTSFIVNNPLL